MSERSCSACKAKLSDNARSCENRGAPASQPAGSQLSAESSGEVTAAKPKRKRKPTVKKMMNEGQHISPNIILCSDGKYRWTYELSLFKNPTIFLLVWKIFFFIFVGICLFVLLMDTLNGYMDGERFVDTLKIFGYIMIGFTVVVSLGYLLYAAVMGGKYIVMFEMDDKGVNHKQIPAQAAKARRLGELTSMLGAASGSLTAVGVGVNSTRTEMYSEFSRVRKVKLYPRRDLIKVNGRLSRNQVYAHKEDFGFVSGFITARVPVRK